MLPGLRPPETPPRLSRELPGIQDGTGRTGQEERRGKPETGNPAEPICTTGSRSKKGHPEPEKGKRMKTEKRLIDAYTLAEEIESLNVTVAGKPARWNDAKYSVLRVIAEQADIDAVEVVHGRWNEFVTPYLTHIRFYKCSVCNRRVEKVENYCPNCGAKMDGDI